MQDGIIKGTGNSRLLKSAITEATTWEAFRAALIAGTLPIDLAGINADGWQQIGMAFAKATMLSDATAALVNTLTGLTPDTPNEAVALIADGVPAKKSHVEYINSSQSWTVPEGITEVDVFLVNGGGNGYGGGDGSYSSVGGAGGYGGACAYIKGFHVTPGSSIPVIVGAPGGGTTIFNNMRTTSSTVNGGTGGAYSTQGGSGALITSHNIYGIRCPIDGEIYGVSGAGGASGVRYFNIQAPGAAGAKGVPPTGGTGVASAASSGTYSTSGGSGASKDNNGNPGVQATATNSATAPAGADATTYGCGGGGGSGGINTTAIITPGAGGAGASGCCILAY